MNIRITKINEAALSAIIEEFGTQSIRKCVPFLEDECLFFIISLVGYNISTDGSKLSIFKDDKSVTIDQSSFWTVIIL